MGHMRDHLTPVHRFFRLCKVPPVSRCMFPAPTIDSSEYTFGDIVGATGCSKSRKCGGKVPRARTLRNHAYMFYYFSLASHVLVAKFVSTRFANAT